MKLKLPSLPPFPTCDHAYALLDAADHFEDRADFYDCEGRHMAGLLFDLATLAALGYGALRLTVMAARGCRNCPPYAASAADSALVRALYRERAGLIAALATTCPAALCDNDPDAGRPVLYLDTPCGQLSWHIDPADLDLVEHLRVIAPDAPGAPVWDRHSSEVKHGRLADYTRLLAAISPVIDPDDALTPTQTSQTPIPHERNPQ